MVVRLQAGLPHVFLMGVLAACSEQSLTPVVVTQSMHTPAIAAAARPKPAPESAPAVVPDRPPQPRGEGFERGVVVGPLLASANDEAFKREHGKLIDRAVALGATDVQLVVRWLQPDAQAVEIAPYDTVHDQLLYWLIDYAKRKKRRVSLAVELGISRVAGTGSDGAASRMHAGRAIKPDSWDRWWWSYQRFAVHYARVASMRKVPSLTIGHALTRTEAQPERWRALIAEVRDVYQGKLSYAASAESFDRVAFWDALDGVTVALEQDEPTSERKQSEKLSPLLTRLNGADATRERGYVLIGRRCGDDDQPKPGDELVCTRALYKSFHADDQLRGVYVPLPVEPGKREPGRPSAAEVVHDWYKEGQPEPTAPTRATPKRAPKKKRVHAKRAASASLRP